MQKQFELLTVCQLCEVSLIRFKNTIGIKAVSHKANMKHITFLLMPKKDGFLKDNCKKIILSF